MPTLMSRRRFRGRRCRRIPSGIGIGIVVSDDVRCSSWEVGRVYQYAVNRDAVLVGTAGIVGAPSPPFVAAFIALFLPIQFFPTLLVIVVWLSRHTQFLSEK